MPCATGSPVVANVVVANVVVANVVVANVVVANVVVANAVVANAVVANAVADHRSALALASLFTAAGITHFARPKPYDAIVPGWVPGPARIWTYASGTAELAVAAAVSQPRSRRAGGLAAAALFAAVFPANVQMAADWRRRSVARRAIAYARLPLQGPLVWWALKVAGAADRPAA